MALRSGIAGFAFAGLLLLALDSVSAHPNEDKPAAEAPHPWKLLFDPEAGEWLQTAADHVKKEDWKNAIPWLQLLLDGDTEKLALLAGRDGKTERYVSVPAEVERLLATMPDAGRRAYQREYGPRAAALLEEARSARDTEALTRLVQRYLYTESGPLGLLELARRHYKAGRFHLAALAYERLLDHLGPARWTNEDLYQATTAFHHRRADALAQRTLKHLLARSQQNIVRIGERRLTSAELLKEVELIAPVEKRLTWPMYRGDGERSNRASGGPPWLTARWRQSMLLDVLQEKVDKARLHIRKAEQQLHEHAEPIISAFSPLALTVHPPNQMKSLLIYKNYFGVTAVDARTGTLTWASPSPWGLQRVSNPNYGPRNAQDIRAWLNYYQSQYPQMLFENSTVNTLSTDGQFIYLVDDLLVPPTRVKSPELEGAKNSPRSRTEPDYREIRVARWVYPFGTPLVRTGDEDDLRDYSPELSEAIAHSRLLALSLPRSGALTWELGGDDKGPLAECYFLAPPLPLDGMLFVLIEKKRQLCLACIDTISEGRQVRPRVRKVWPLIQVASSLRIDPLRRAQAAHLAYSDGILVCPTNNGAVLGFDLLAGRVAWVYPYVRKGDAAPRFDRMGRSLEAGTGEVPPNHHHWKVTAPVIADGKVVFTPPDQPTIHCLNAADGSLLWSHKKGSDDLYLGGVADGKVLIVGMKTVHARHLTTGEILWTLETGLPSGQGILADRVFYLPLARSTTARQPEICAIDVTTGTVIAHHQTRPRTPEGKDLDTPGNLLFVDNSLISVTPWEVVAYPRLKLLKKATPEQK